MTRENEPTHTKNPRPQIEANALRALHDKHGLSFVEIAKRIGLSDSHCSASYKSGKWGMPYELACRHILRKMDREAHAAHTYVVRAHPDQSEILKNLAKGMGMSLIRIDGKLGNE